jgi:hypothetical protein
MNWRAMPKPCSQDLPAVLQAVEAASKDTGKD